MDTLMLETILTARTCGEACWAAREDVCRCSCRGVNHGCLRGENGTRPARSSKIRGERFNLAAADSYKNIHRDRRLIYHPDHILETIGVVVRKASASEVERWPELAPFRGQRFQYWQEEPYLVWVRDGLAYAPF